MTTDSYHYRTCGLDNVYLVNGFSIKETRYGQAVTIDDMDGLHRTIGRRLALKKKDLAGRELRFLRHELGLSQDRLGRLLGRTSQAVARWEKGQARITDPAQSLIRLLYLEHVGGNRKIKALLQEFEERDEVIEERRMIFKETERGWRPHLAAA